jgi:hypothetical protein
MWNYDRIKEEAKARNIAVTDLIALAPGNDAFYSGKPADIVIARWFANLWEQFGYSTGVHLRRVHYQIISQDPPVKLPAGMKIKIGPDEYTEVYHNYDACWNFLTQASKHARYLGYIDPAAFDDRRNPEAYVNAQLSVNQPWIGLYDNLWQSPRLPEFPTLPEYSVSDFDPRQRYMIEIWAEKSTVNDVLRPLCEEYGANLQTGLGEMSITATLNAVERVKRSGRPTRIFYISDFDPAGQSMPVAVSRKIEYFVRQAEEYLDIQLYPVVLTAEQVETYGLPRTPIKETERRASRFEDRFGSGAVELDALEALHPGTLADILRRHIDDYFDYDLGGRVERARVELEEKLEEVRQGSLKPHLDQIAALRKQYQAIREQFQDSIDAYSKEQIALWRTIAQEMREQAPDLNEFPIPEADENEQEWYSDPLYSTERDYIEQITAYKEFQGKEALV